jgi:RNA processing factor Prp31
VKFIPRRLYRLAVKLSPRQASSFPRHIRDFYIHPTLYNKSTTLNFSIGGHLGQRYVKACALIRARHSTTLQQEGNLRPPLSTHHCRNDNTSARITSKMATLEQELMADFADSGDEDLADLENDFAGGESPKADGHGDEDMVDEEAEYAAEHGKKEKKGPADIRGAQTLMKNLTPVLEQIDVVKDQTPEILDGESIEDTPEYQLLKEANEFSTQIDGEIQAVHKFIRDRYSARFPYLEELVKNPVDYAATVAVLGNRPLKEIKTIAQSPDNVVGIALNTILPAPTLMVISVEATRAEGRDLDDAELEIVVDACKLLLQLNKTKDTFRDFVQSRMTIFAPNLTALVGSLTAAQLINHAGGIHGLAKTPACNIAPLGQNKASGLGLATNTGVRNQGFLYHSPILQTIRQDLKKQAMRILSGKVILAARVDSVGQSRNAETGNQLKDECERRLDKLTEPPKNNGVRALPAPDDKPSRKRGGRRARAQKGKPFLFVPNLRDANYRNSKRSHDRDPCSSKPHGIRQGRKGNRLWRLDKRHGYGRRQRYRSPSCTANRPQDTRQTLEKARSWMGRRHDARCCIFAQGFRRRWHRYLSPRSGSANWRCWAWWCGHELHRVHTGSRLRACRSQGQGRDEQEKEGR